jgi:GH25 family lysozyme M1 (1,4-beta-N-acetylmuramidase)/GH24 family phage-related lysozyme (muramidase)
MLVVICFLLLPGFAANETVTFELSQAGLEFIKRYEKFHSTTYSSNNKWYIGYGTRCEENEYPEGIDEEKGEELLRNALLPHVNTVNQFLTQKNITLKQNQFDALISFTYSVGSSWTSPTNRISNYLVEGIHQYDDAEIVDSLAVFCHVKGKVNESYLDRRIDEGRLLLYGDYSSNDSTEFRYLILNAASGSVVNDVVCYEANKPYGEFPSATRKGYQLEGWYKNGKKLTAEMQASENASVTAKWTASDPISFSDVMKTDWFYSYVCDLYKSNVIDGYSADRFAPQDTLTRGQALKLILLAASYSEQKPTGNHWASGYLTFATNQGFLPSESVNLDEEISRQEIATIAAKALKLSDVNITSPFSDTSDPAVLSLYHLGILTGSQENNVFVFKPADNITRAEISAVIWRIQQTNPKDETPEPEPTPDPEPDHTNQIQFAGKWVNILDGVPLNEYIPGRFYQSNGFKLYKSDEYRCEIGVDVSVHQGDEIDWNKVKAAGVDFAIIRVAGRGWGSEGNLYDDKNFKKNIEGALAANLKVGVYFFSQAITVEEAIEEAKYTVTQLKDYPITYPVVFDWEKTGGKETRTYGLATDTLCAAANAFCKTVEEAGYPSMIYFNCDVGYLKYDLRQILQHDFWLAQYAVSTPTFYYNFQMWQYSSTGTVDGIPKEVDLNLYWIKK